MTHKTTLKEHIVRRVFQTYFRLRRPLTLGVRALVINKNGEIFLIRNTYVPGWQLPGGGVEKNQTALEALRDELLQEGGITFEKTPALFAIYSNHQSFKNDHVLLYVLRAFTRSHIPEPNMEIAESGFFAPDNLPDDTTPATRARIAEVLNDLTPSQHWS